MVEEAGGKDSGVCNDHEGPLKGLLRELGESNAQILIKIQRGIQENIPEIKAMQHRCTIRVDGPSVITSGEKAVALEDGNGTQQAAGSSYVSGEQGLQSGDRLCVDREAWVEIPD